MINFLSDIISVNNDIINEYKTSKFFKHPFKNIWLSKERNRLMKLVNFITSDNTSIPISIINEYAMLLSDNYKPYGQLKHCRRAMRCGKNLALIIFEINFNEQSSVVVSINPSSIDGTKASINYSYIVNHKPSLSFSDNDVNALNIYDKSLLEYFDFAEFANNEKLGDAIRNNTCKYIIEDIVDYMKSIIYREVQ